MLFSSILLRLKSPLDSAQALKAIFWEPSPPGIGHPSTEQSDTLATESCGCKTEYSGKLSGGWFNGVRFPSGSSRKNSATRRRDPSIILMDASPRIVDVNAICSA